MKAKPIDILKERLIEISHLCSACAVLGWDQEVHMPQKGIDARSAACSILSSVVHKKLVAIDDDGLLSSLKKQVDLKKITGKQATIITETWRSFERQRKLPEALVKELSETESKSQHAWAEARKNNDFKSFLPWLQKIVELKRAEANLVGFSDSPYDALLDSYEPGMTTKEASVILNDLKDFLVPFLKELKHAKVKIDQKRILGRFPLEQQFAFNRFVSEKMGFDYTSGRMDQSTHPFTTTFHTRDVRITTRFKENNLLYALSSTIHEVGHALYEQGLPSEEFGTPLSEAISLGIHESQSRLWENSIGKSVEFWKYFYPRLQKKFPKPFEKIPLNEFIQIINAVKPSLIRTEADEVTYNLHIILRFEIEKEMIEGTIDLADLPLIWKTKMKEYLGIDVPNDSVGVLQDVHWSAGMIGYFPTYSLGNIYAAQFYNAMQCDIPDFSKKVSIGNLKEPREWLRRNIHIHGKTYKAAELVKQVTGEYPTSRYFIDYLSKKYEKVYSLKVSSK